MSLRARTLLAVSATLACLGLGFYLVLRLIVEAGFSRVEEADGLQQVQRVRHALAADLAALEGIARDWGGWDDTYAFIEDRNPRYLRSNLLVETTFVDNRLDVIALLDRQGTIVFQRAYDHLERRALPFPDDLLPHLAAGRLARVAGDGASGRTGLLRLQQGLLLASIQPILRSDASGPARGVLLFGRFLGAAAVQRLAASTLVVLAVSRLDRADVPADVRDVLPALTGPDAIAVRPASTERLAGYTALRDLYGEPALVLRVELPRPILAQARLTTRWLMTGVTVLGLVAGGLIWLILERGVLQRVLSLSHSVQAIGRRRDFTARVTPSGHDELARLAEAINGMLQALGELHRERELDRSLREELETRLREAHKLEAIGRLAAGLAEDFRGVLALAADHARAATARVEPAHPARRELEHVLGAVERGLGLAQQLGARGGGGAASTDLAAAVARLEPKIRRLVDARTAVVLEVPEAPCRVPLDEAQVERIVTNLVENARDAMPAGGRLTVAVRPHAPPDPAAGRPAVLLSVADTGTGMTPETRARIFEPFFTTKDRRTGRGLGLAAVHALVRQAGGHVTVASAPGEGSTFTVHLPAVDA